MLRPVNWRAKISGPSGTGLNPDEMRKLVPGAAPAPLPERDKPSAFFRSRPRWSPRSGNTSIPQAWGGESAPAAGGRNAFQQVLQEDSTGRNLNLKLQRAGKRSHRRDKASHAIEVALHRALARTQDDRHPRRCNPSIARCPAPTSSHRPHHRGLKHHTRPKYGIRWRGGISHPHREWLKRGPRNNLTRPGNCIHPDQRAHHRVPRNRLARIVPRRHACRHLHIHGKVRQRQRDRRIALAIRYRALGTQRSSSLRNRKVYRASTLGFAQAYHLRGDRHAH